MIQLNFTYQHMGQGFDFASIVSHCYPSTNQSTGSHKLKPHAQVADHLP